MALVHLADDGGVVEGSPGDPVQGVQGLGEVVHDEADHVGVSIQHGLVQRGGGGRWVAGEGELQGVHPGGHLLQVALSGCPVHLEDPSLEMWHGEVSP